MNDLKDLIKSMLPDWFNRRIGAILHCQNYFLDISLKLAVKAQNLQPLYDRLSEIVPDISRQYSHTNVSEGWFRTKVRAHHAFQISLVQKALLLTGINPASGHTIVDIGDSAGTHLQYLQGLYPGIKALSINLDQEAVEKIKKKGLPAICARAEDLGKHSINADLYLAFELLEHLNNPAAFLHSLSEDTTCKALILSVPYITASRIGLHHIRRGNKNAVFAENTHLFELSPADWGLLFRHAGWRVIYDQIYLQYPRHGLLYFMKNRWKKVDFEGSYGAILVKDKSWSSLYKDWNEAAG